MKTLAAWWCKLFSCRAIFLPGQDTLGWDSVSILSSLLHDKNLLHWIYSGAEVELLISHPWKELEYHFNLHRMEPTFDISGRCRTFNRRWEIPCTELQRRKLSVEAESGKLSLALPTCPLGSPRTRDLQEQLNKFALVGLIMGRDSRKAQMQMAFFVASHFQPSCSALCCI